MSYNTETTNVQFMNQSFFQKIDSGMTKEAGVAMSAFVRQKLREDSFVRKVLPFQSITAAELDRQTSEEPTIICEKEPDSIAATLPFLSRSQIRYWTGARYPVNFQKIASDDFRKSKFELMTYRTDIRTVLQDNSIKDMQEQEDLGFYSNLMAIQAQNAALGVDNKYTIAGGFSKANYLAGIKKLIERRLPVGCVLMSQSMYNDMLAFQSTDIGSPAASSLFMGEAQLQAPFGYKIITTNKSNASGTSVPILPTNRMIVFAPPAFLGQAYSIQDATLFLKAEMDMIEFTAYESIGVGIGNTQGFVVIDF
jgi:hypothetical protein